MIFGFVINEDLKDEMMVIVIVIGFDDEDVLLLVFIFRVLRVCY